MKKIAIVLITTSACIASQATAGKRQLDIDVKVSPASAQLETSIRQGKFLISQREYGLAIVVFRKVLRSDPDNAAAYSAMAVAYDGLGRQDLARKNFELALAYAPFDEKHYRNLARHLSATGKLALAQKVMRDFDIARMERQSSVDILPEQLANLVDNTDVPSATPASDFPVNIVLPEKPAIPSEEDVKENRKAILRRLPAISNAEAGDTGPNAGNLNGDDDYAGTQKTPVEPVGATHVVRQSGLTELHEVLAEVYEGLGNSEMASKTRLIAGMESRIEPFSTTESGSSAAQGLQDWLENLGNRYSLTATDTPSRKTVLVSGDAHQVRPKHEKSGTYLVRQSLGEVLLMTKAPSPQKPGAGIKIARQVQPVNAKGPDPVNPIEETRRYYAAVRSVLDLGAPKFAEIKSGASHDLLMKEVDLTMADLRQKQFDRMPRVDRGPSPGMQKLATSLYRYAAAEMRQESIPNSNKLNGRGFADVSIRTRISFGLRPQCVA